MSGGEVLCITKIEEIEGRRIVFDSGVVKQLTPVPAPTSLPPPPSRPVPTQSAIAPQPLSNIRTVTISMYNNTVEANACVLPKVQPQQFVPTVQSTPLLTRSQNTRFISAYRFGSTQWVYQNYDIIDIETFLNALGPGVQTSGALSFLDWTIDDNGQSSPKLFMLLIHANLVLLIDSRYATHSLSPITVLQKAASRLSCLFVHDCYNTSCFLKDLSCDILDTQLVYEHMTGVREGSSRQLMEWMELDVRSNNATQGLQASHVNHSLVLNQQRLLLAHEDTLLAKLKECGSQNILVYATKLRISHGFAANGAALRPIRFNRESYSIISAELPDRAPMRNNDHHVPRQMQRFCSLAKLINLIPPPFNNKFSRDDAVEKMEEETIDFIIDFDRRPYYNDKQGVRHYLSDDPLAVVTKEHIQSISDSLVFGPDNRAVLSGELHRISAMKDKSEDIYGFTMRVGRYFAGNSYIITDLLFHDDLANKSILVLGIPGSGKTSLIREMARSLAEHSNVCIIDTSNEICGDGHRPHSCVGHARRMMVSNISEQAAVMIECVQNHTPRIMVIDEIGRSQEVKAASTIKQRGVRIIASAHGDFRSLMKNKELNSLLGGVESVTLGDAEARKNDGRKIQAIRGGEPIFDIVIELECGKHNECRVIMNTADAVDAILTGQSAKVQRRVRQPSASSQHQQQHTTSFEQDLFVEDIDL
eukprot:gene502-541_t